MVIPGLVPLEGSSRNTWTVPVYSVHYPQMPRIVPHTEWTLSISLLNEWMNGSGWAHESHKTSAIVFTWAVTLDIKKEVSHPPSSPCSCAFWSLTAFTFPGNREDAAISFCSSANHPKHIYISNSEKIISFLCIFSYPRSSILRHVYFHIRLSLIAGCAPWWTIYHSLIGCVVFCVVVHNIMLSLCG